MTEEYLTGQEVAARLRRSIRTVEWWRQFDPPRGPKFIRLNGQPLYPVADFEKYQQELYANST